MLKKLIVNLVIVSLALCFSVSSEAGRKSSFKVGKRQKKRSISILPIAEESVMANQLSSSVNPYAVPLEIWEQIFKYLPTVAVVRLNQASKTFQTYTEERMRLEKIMPQLIELKKGSFIYEEVEEVLNDRWINRIHVQIENDFFLGKDPVTREKYEALMGAEKLNAVIERGLLSSGEGDNLPMTSLTEEEVKEYIEVLNSEVKKLWPRAFGRTVPVVFRLPSAVEWEYGTTKPLAKPKTVKFEGRQVEITAKRMRYSGTDSEPCLPKYAIFGKRRLFPVDFIINEGTGEKLRVNSRGLRGMSGGVHERVIAVTIPRNHTYPVVNAPHCEVRGGCSHSSAQRCHTSYVPYYWLHESWAVGFRLAAEYPSAPVTIDP